MEFPLVHFNSTHVIVSGLLGYSIPMPKRLVGGRNVLGEPQGTVHADADGQARDVWFHENEEFQ